MLTEGPRRLELLRGAETWRSQRRNRPSSAAIPGVPGSGSVQWARRDAWAHVEAAA